MRLYRTSFWGALLCSPFAFGQPEYTEVIDLASPVIVEQTAPAAAGDGSQLSDLYLLTQQLATEVRELRGLVEEQGFELRKLQQQRLDDYKDIDKRIADLAANGVVMSQEASNTAKLEEVGGITEPTKATSDLSEKEMYRQAYNLVKARQFDKAVPAFKQFLEVYPQGDYAGNAYYWLGELYVLENDFTASQMSMEALIAQFPEHRKVPDAYYKLAKLYKRLGDDEKAQSMAQKVITDYSGKSDTLVQLAREFLETNYPD